jgi:hypothetical protein
MLKLDLHRLYAVTTTILFAALVGLAATAFPVVAADKPTSDKIIGGTVACGAFYRTDVPNGANGAAWKFSNFNAVPIYIQRIRIYKWDGSLYSDYLWNGSNFADQQMIGGNLPYDDDENIGHDDNVLGAFQPFQYGSNPLFAVGALPPNESRTTGGGVKGHVTLMVDWMADVPVYPLMGTVTRNVKNLFMDDFDAVEAAMHGRSDHECHMIHIVTK